MTEAAALAAVSGLRATPQRVAIIRALEGKRRPVTAQTLHEEIRGRGGPGLATVYRTLRALADAGTAETFPAGEGEVAYKLCEVDHHHHLICERCGQVATIPSCEVEDWASAVGRRRGFAVTGHRADVYGLCASCRRR
ncbi:MAG TPA: Fur family transcriptional regulator [Actinomycetota bacterium]|nr:Fur family transcriptional regulator [Actinomycetota bacterium]